MMNSLPHSLTLEPTASRAGHLYRPTMPLSAPRPLLRPRPIGVAASVTLRLTDRGDVLFAQSTAVDFEVVDVVRDRSRRCERFSAEMWNQNLYDADEPLSELLFRRNRDGDEIG